MKRTITHALAALAGALAVGAPALAQPHHTRPTRPCTHARPHAHARPRARLAPAPAVHVPAANTPSPAPSTPPPAAVEGPDEEWPERPVGQQELEAIEHERIEE